jgi:hypothetical protein
MNLTIRNAPPGARARMVVASPAGDKRHTFEVAVPPNVTPWSTAVQIVGMPPGSSADLVVLDSLGNVVSRSSTTLP